MLSITALLRFMRENCSRCQHEGVGQPKCPIQVRLLAREDVTEASAEGCTEFKARKD